MPLNNFTTCAKRPFVSDAFSKARTSGDGVEDELSLSCDIYCEARTSDDLADFFQQYASHLASAPGTVKIAKKEWRDGFGAVLSESSSRYVLTGARVDDNGLAKITGSSSTTGYTKAKHDDLFQVFRSLENQNHLGPATGGSVADGAPEDTNWYQHGLTSQSFSVALPDDTSTETRIHNIEGDVTYNHAYVIVDFYGDADRDATMYAKFRRSGSSDSYAISPTVRRNDPQTGSSTKDASTRTRHFSVPLLRLAPGTEYELVLCFASSNNVAMGDATATSTHEHSLTLKTRHRPYHPASGTTTTISSRTSLKSRLEGGADESGNTIIISAGDYTLASERSGTQTTTEAWEIDIYGTASDPALVIGDGEVLLPRCKLKDNCSHVIFQNLKFCNFTNNPSFGATSPYLEIEQDSHGVTLADIELHWHADMPSTCEEAINQDTWHDNWLGIKCIDGSSGDSVTDLTIMNSKISPGKVYDISNALAGNRIGEFLTDETMDIRAKQCVIEHNAIWNIYDNSLSGFSGSSATSRGHFFYENQFWATNDDWLELDRSQGGQVLIGNQQAGACRWEQVEQGYSILPEYVTGRVIDNTITAVNSLGSGRWECTFDSVPNYGMVYQDGKYYLFEDNYPNSRSNPCVITDALFAIHGNSLVPFASHASPHNDAPVAGTSGTPNCKTMRDNSYGSSSRRRQKFSGSNTLSSQGNCGSLPVWLINNQHTGANYNGAPDVPYKFKSSPMALNILNCFSTQAYDWDRASNLNDVYSDWMIGQQWIKKSSGYFDNNSSVNASVLGTQPWPRATGDDGTNNGNYQLWDYNCYFNNSLQSYSDKWYIYGATLAQIPSRYGVDSNSQEVDQNTENDLQNQYENAWSEPFDTNLPANCQRPNFAPSRASDIGTFDPLYAKHTGDLYGAGLPTTYNAGLTRAMGPCIDSSDDVTIIGLTNKSTDQYDISPQQNGLGPTPAGQHTLGDRESYQLPTGWTVQSNSNTTLMASLGLNPTESVRLFVTNSDQTVGLIVEK